MVRFLYRCLLRLHPPYFRQRFGEEMLWIFDQAVVEKGVVRLLADAVLSLMRQWLLRPEFQEAPLPAGGARPALDGVPVFYTFRSSLPGAGALIHGGILSLGIFSAVSFTFIRGHQPLRTVFSGAQAGGYSQHFSLRRPAVVPAGGVGSARLGKWTPRIVSDPDSVWSKLMLWFSTPAASQSHMQFGLPGTPAARRLQEWLRALNAGDMEALRRFYASRLGQAGDPPAAENAARTWVEWRGRLGPLQIRNLEQSDRHQIVALAQTSNGVWWRVVFRAGAGQPIITQLAPLPPPAPLPPAEAIPPIEVSEELLRTYAGTYVVESSNNLKVGVTLDRGQLNIQFAGEPKSALVAVSETMFVLAGTTDRWIEFAKDNNGKVNELHIHRSGQQLKAHRQGT